MTFKMPAPMIPQKSYFVGPLTFNIAHYREDQLKQALRDVLEQVHNEIKTEGDYSGSNRKEHLHSLLPRIRAMIKEIPE